MFRRVIVGPTTFSARRNAESSAPRGATMKHWRKWVVVPRDVDDGMEIELQNLGAVVANCWERAEETTRKAVAEKYFVPGEEQITFLFG
jgi:hypothetical protein